MTKTTSKVSNRFDLDRGMFPLAFSVFRANLFPCMTAAVLLLAANAGQGYLPATLAFAVVRALIIMIIGYSAYRTLLTAGRVQGWRAVSTRDGRVPWRYAGVMLMILWPMLVLGIVLTSPGNDIGAGGIPGLVMMGVMVIAYTVAYVLLGTALPEVAERGEVALSEAIERGRANYKAIARSMVLGPWLFRALSMAAMIGLNLAGVTTDLFGSQMGLFQPAALAPMLMFTTCHVFAEVLTAIVMVRAYRRCAPVRKGAVAVSA
jgi:hypothetical protein